MLISPFTPLFFIDRKTDGIESPYRQVFSTTDRIFVQLICDAGEEEGDWLLYEEPEHSPFCYINRSEWDINEGTSLRFAVLNPPPGMYSLGIEGVGTCLPFRVTDDPQELANTTLIQYSMHNNRQRDDAVFFVDGMQYFFDFRVPGGFKDSNWAFGVDSEQFVTDHADITQLFAIDSIQQKFTLGHSQGCPVWFGALLNRLLCCTYVYFDGVRYARKESSVPEMEIQLEGVNSFVFTQNLQRVVHLDPKIENNNMILLRRTGAGLRTLRDDTIFRKI